MTSQLTPLFEKPQDTPTLYDGLLGWSGEWKCYFDQENKPVPLDDIVSLSPDEETLIVRPGDTLGKIAQEHYCSVKKLASFNELKDPATIHPGQVIKIPPIHYAFPDAGNEAGSDRCTVEIHFEDLIEKPIAGLKVKIVSALGDVYDSVTDGLGKITELTLKTETELKIFVSSATGKIKEVVSFTPLPGKVTAIISSPKVRVKGKSIPMKGSAGEVGGSDGKINTMEKGRDPQGAPRIHINHTCPNRYDLMLNKNIIYWNQIIAASERSGIIPQCIAAVINAEAAKYPGGVWNPMSICIDSANSTEGIPVYKSSAAGMTQFLNGTWMSETFREGTWLYENALSQGLLADRPVLDKKGQELKNKKGETRYARKFQIAPDIWESLQGLKEKHIITGVTPYPRRATTSVQKWLNLRFNPEYAIMAAVDYGVANLISLKNAGYNIDGLNDAEKSKLIYLTHHLGLKNAELFIKNAIGEDEARMLLNAQVGVASSKKRFEKEGGYIKAHREWLITYINKNISLRGYFCQELTNSPGQEDVNLNIILIKL